MNNKEKYKHYVVGFIAAFVVMAAIRGLILLQDGGQKSSADMIEEPPLVQDSGGGYGPWDEIYWVLLGLGRNNTADLYTSCTIVDNHYDCGPANPDSNLEQ